MASGSLSAARPVIVAVLLTAVGELLIFFLFGVFLFPTGSLAAKAYWTGTCGIAMGLVIGAVVILPQHWIPGGRALAFAAAVAYFAVLAYCDVLCFTLDLQLGLFGAAESPQLFVWSGLIAAAVTAPFYARCLYSEAGQRLTAFADRGG